MANEEVVLAETRGAVRVLTINRPNVYNALNSSVLARLSELTTEAVGDGMRAVVLTGSGPRAFSAGADLDEFAGLDAVTAQERLSAGQRVMNTVESCPIPVIAAVNGLALGGGFELVLASTFPVLATNASLGLPESGLGLIPGYGGTQRLPRAIGRASAAYAMLTGDRILAERAYELGLTPLPPVAPEELLPTALGVAETIASKGPRAQSAILSAMRTATADAHGLALEANLGAIATGSAEAAEGIAAFLEKRSPDFDQVSR
ncbi:enoyl-CoA hydratase/isomerase family protein [Salinibacterium sp. GXW1014]|uniref:enoyl-CoA hydratase/isomerase family protein n=1 Tax=Salinibacterium sp. GXW1014 TaxID=3377838 RepID=UPI00383BE568